ncbi:MAG: hypothetical protein WA364_19495 [Candidatus Nitrosopolaris sp.]
MKPVDRAVSKFLSDVEMQYNKKIGFESEINRLREEVNMLNQELTRSELLVLPFVGPKLIRLTQN